ncbi:hypothetical protein PITC_068550 [Penicillium italicum]|uniref:Uncharacterized protein n=1 Tax=Penicillium italicum TaxID=40296 RepID=A0A0A2LE49_PENIT|nr:hypothetical protein PITC_068550 [Penicillium italicum]
MPVEGLGLISPFLQQSSYHSSFESFSCSPMLPPTLKYGIRQATSRWPTTTAMD